MVREREEETMMMIIRENINTIPHLSIIPLLMIALESRFPIIYIKWCMGNNVNIDHYIFILTSVLLFALGWADKSVWK